MKLGTNELNDRWSITNVGQISWDVKHDNQLPHADHIEMSGKKISSIIKYGVDAQGELMLSRLLIWPTLRTIPNNTHASLKQEYGTEQVPTPSLSLQVNGIAVQSEKPEHISFGGILTIKSKTNTDISIIRSLFPSVDEKVFIEKIEIRNESGESVSVNIESISDQIVRRGVKGIYLLNVKHDAIQNVTIKSNSSYSFAITFSGRGVMEPKINYDFGAEQAKREALVRRTQQSLCLETPDSVFNQGFSFAKLRLIESIYDTKGGFMHGPGGGSYYAAVWTNDQAEYAGPLFPFLGDADGNKASMNAYQLYMPFMGPDYTAIPSSIIAEGVDIWEGVGDRGDASMYAYGASRFALAMGDRVIAEQLWPAITWCLEYNRRNMTADGIITSDSDELENRFPSGDANLSTSSLGYGALRSAAGLAKSLGKLEDAEQFDKEAEQLAINIEKYFGAVVEGYSTYRYYDGNDVLRSWICIPLTMGITTRKEGTLDALFESRLWTQDGLATQAGDTTFWDRSTLYGFRAAFSAGEVKRALPYLQSYARRRLLGNHVPYAVEAYPEGNQRHLSAESALYCRMFTEGLFGIELKSLNSFHFIPRLPEEWNEMALRRIHLFGYSFDLEVKRAREELNIIVIIDNKKVEIVCAPDTTIEASFSQNGVYLSKLF